MSDREHNTESHAGQSNFAWAHALRRHWIAKVAAARSDDSVDDDTLDAYLARLAETERALRDPRPTTLDELLAKHAFAGELLNASEFGWRTDGIDVLIFARLAEGAAALRLLEQSRAA